MEHPESSAAEQKKFIKDLRALLSLVEQGVIINPFKETSQQLITLDTGEVMDPEIINCLREASTIGQTMFREFVRDRIETASKPLSDVIPRAGLYTFSNRPPVDLKNVATKLGSAKSNAALITKLFLFLRLFQDPMPTLKTSSAMKISVSRRHFLSMGNSCLAPNLHFLVVY